MKKRGYRIVATVAVCLAVIGGISAQKMLNAKVGCRLVKCRCNDDGPKGCYADGSSSNDCANLSEKCWDFHKNCKGYTLEQPGPK